MAETMEKPVLLLPWRRLSVLLISRSDDEEQTHPATLPVRPAEANGAVKDELPRLIASSRVTSSIDRVDRASGSEGADIVLTAGDGGG